jgi:hypothetical protein
VGVLGDKQRVEAALFYRCGQGAWRDSFVGDERRNTELHPFIEPYQEERMDTHFLIGFHTSEVQGHRIWAKEDLRKKVTDA